MLCFRAVPFHSNAYLQQPKNSVWPGGTSSFRLSIYYDSECGAFDGYIRCPTLRVVCRINVALRAFFGLKCLVALSA